MSNVAVIAIINGTSGREGGGRKKEELDCINMHWLRIDYKEELYLQEGSSISMI